MDRRSLIALGAVALALGAVTPMLASASEYDDLGTVDEGVYAVASDESTLRVQADEAVGLVVRAVDGDVVNASELDAGDERTIVLDEEHAIVAVNGGEATIEAKGQGTVEPVPTTREPVTLAEANQTDVDRSLAVQVPEGALLASAVLDGQARHLSLAVTADGDTLLASDEAGLATPAALAPTAAQAQALDVELEAEALDGTVELTFLTLSEAPAHAEAVSHEEEADDRLNATVDAHDLAYVPVTFTVPEGEEDGRLLLEIDTGYIFDASLYDADGTQTHHVHAGPALAEHRTQCESSFDCPRGGSYEELAPQTIEHSLEAGEHVLFVREGAVQGTLTIEGPSGEPLLPEAEVGDVTTVDVASDRGLEIESPLVDVWRTYDHQSGQASPEIDVDVEDETVFAYTALAHTSGQAAESDTEMQPSAMQAGNVTVTVDALGGNPLADRHGVVLVLPTS